MQTFKMGFLHLFTCTYNLCSSENMLQSIATEYFLFLGLQIY